jgi:hypothetical protein
VTADRRVPAALLAVLLVTSVVGVAAAVPVAPDGTSADAGSAPPTTTRAAPTATAPLDDDTEAFVDCVNGTSDAILACGYTPGPNAVEIAPQTVAGDDAVTVRAAELSEGGFVAVHRVSYVDGAFTESLVGVSRYLQPGLHGNVRVDVDGVDSNATLVAVLNRDSDDDRRYDFVATDGAQDRPYTNTYSERAGNVSDEAGDVIGDLAPVTVITVETYAGADGVVSTDELQSAVNDFVMGDIDTELFQAVIRAWATSEG